MTHHSLDIRVYYEDTDAGGVVYHASYLRFAERARTEFLRKTGFQNSALEKEHGTLFVVKHMDIDYKAPGFLDDLLRVDTSIESLKNSSFIMRQRVFRANKNSSQGDLLTDMHVAIVCVDAKTIKPVRLADDIRAEFKKYLESGN